MIVYKATFFGKSAFAYNNLAEVSYNLGETVSPKIDGTPLFTFSRIQEALREFPDQIKEFGLLVCKVEDTMLYQSQKYMINPYLFEKSLLFVEYEKGQKILKSQWDKISNFEKDIEKTPLETLSEFIYDFLMKNPDVMKVPEGTVLVKQLDVKKKLSRMEISKLTQSDVDKFENL